MMTTIPFMVTVADLQRGYRSIVDKMKKSGEPLVVVNNGEPDVVLMDTAVYNSQVAQMREIEEEYLLKLAQEAREEYGKGKTVKLKKGQKLLDVL